jgi:hypothetical protein
MAKEVEVITINDEDDEKDCKEIIITKAKKNALKRKLSEHFLCFKMKSM